MIARNPLPDEYLQWNLAQWAPFGRDDSRLRRFPLSLLPGS